MPVVLGIVRSGWSGTSGGPGLTQLAIAAQTDPHTWDATAAQVAVDAVRVFWDAIKANLPDEVVITVSPVVDIYTITTGELVGSHQAAVSPTSVQGTSAAVFSMASGLKVNLNTGIIRDGRRVRGGIFVVPAASGAYGTTGLISSAVRTSINSALNTMRGTLAAANKDLVVWSRPTSPGPSTDGDYAPVTGAETSEKVAILKGRRD